METCLHRRRAARAQEQRAALRIELGVPERRMRLAWACSLCVLIAAGTGSDPRCACYDATLLTVEPGESFRQSRTLSTIPHRMGKRRFRPRPCVLGGRSPDACRANDCENMKYRFSIAPMMEWTDRHCRFFHRLLTRRALLYTEMITTGAVLHGDRARLLAFDPGRASGCAPTRRLGSPATCAMRAHRRGPRLRRGQPQRRLSVGPGAGGPLRRLPDGRARARRRLRRRHDRQRQDSGHRQMPHRHRRAGSGGGARSVDQCGRSRPGLRRSSCMRARRGWPASRRAKTAMSRRSTTPASTGSRRRIAVLPW